MDMKGCAGVKWRLARQEGGEWRPEGWRWSSGQWEGDEVGVWREGGALGYVVRTLWVSGR